MVTVLEHIDPRQKKEMQCLDYISYMFEHSDEIGQASFGFLLSLYATCAEDPKVRERAKEYADRNKIPPLFHEGKGPIIHDTQGVVCFKGKLHWEANVGI